MQKTGSIFSPAYWRAAAGELKDPRRLALCAMFCALAVAVSSLSFVIGENLYVYFTCYVNVIACAVCGPVLGLIYGAAADTLSFLLFTHAGYFPGYLLSECLGDLIYALLLYRRRVSVTRLFAARFLVNYGVNVALGSVWSAVLFGKGYLYYMLKSLVKNTILLPFEVVVMAALFAMLLPALSRAGLLGTATEAQRSRLRPGKSALPVFGVDLLLCAAAAAYYGAASSDPAVLFVISGAAGATGLALLVAAVFRARRARKDKSDS